MQTLLLPSIARTVTDAERRNIEMRVYLAVDSDDVWWQDHAGNLRSEPWLPVHTLTFEKKGKRIPFNEAAAQAYEHGADYITRLNDDTEMISPGWVTLGMNKLRQNSNVGVVGPHVTNVLSTAARSDVFAASHLLTASKRNQILTHDLVRTRSCVRGYIHS
eukprot:COSAG06_NODE_1153_length_10481_cov_1445.985070_7_plen_160_part_01